MLCGAGDWFLPAFPSLIFLSMVQIDSRATMHVLVPKTTHAASVWDAFTHCYKIPVLGVETSGFGVVVLVPSPYARALHRHARNERPTATNPLFIIPDAGVEEMAACGFDYHYNDNHPMHYIGLKQPALVSNAPSVRVVQAQESSRAKRKRAATKIALFFAVAGNRAKSRELDSKAEALAAMTRRKEQLALCVQGASEEANRMKSECRALRKKCQTTEKDRDQLVGTTQSVMSERDEARRERDKALQRIVQLEKKNQTLEEAPPEVPVVTAAPMASVATPVDPKAAMHKEAFDILKKLRNFYKLDQLISFCNTYNKDLKKLIMALKTEIKQLIGQCRRLETENSAKVKKLEKSVNQLKEKIKKSKRHETYERVCAKLMKATGAKDGKRLEEILVPLHDIASDFDNFGERPPLRSFLLWLETLSNLVGRGNSQHWKVPKLFALYNELSKFNEGHNTVDAMHILNVAIEQKGLSSLSAASVRLAKPALVVDVGRYDASLALKPLPTEKDTWTKEYTAQLYQFCLHHTCDFTGDHSLLEIMVSLQDSHPVNISKAASQIHMVFANVVKLFTKEKESMEGRTHEHFFKAVFMKCQAGWQKRPFLLKCNNPTSAIVASRAMCLRSCFQIAGVEIVNCKVTPPLLVRMARQFPKCSKEDYDLLLENEGECLTGKHMFTLAAIKDPLKNAAFPWCTKQVFMKLQQTQLLWDIVLTSEKMHDARRILMRIIGTGYVTDEQIMLFRQQCMKLNSFSILYCPENTTSAHNTIEIKEDLTIVVSGPRWEQSVAEQMGCTYPDVHTTKEEYWNFIYQWVGKELCEFFSDWHVSVAAGLAVEEPGKANIDKKGNEELQTSREGSPTTPAEFFMKTVDEGLRRAKENGSMSRKDIAELQATADKMNAKIQFVDMSNKKARKAFEELREGTRFTV